MSKYKVFICFEDTFETEINASDEDEALELAIKEAESVLCPTCDIEMIEDDPDEEKPDPPMEGQISLFSEEADHAKP